LEFFLGFFPIPVEIEMDECVFRMGIGQVAIDFQR